jgi:hypothetical protein
LVLNLADDLTAKGFKGLLISALTDFRRFYRTYSGIGQTLSGQLGESNTRRTICCGYPGAILLSWFGAVWPAPPFEQLSVG